MKFNKGDYVRYIDGHVDWLVTGFTAFTDGSVNYRIQSGMSGRNYTAWEHELRPWQAHE